jgi:hypothetical protein
MTKSYKMDSRLRGNDMNQTIVLMKFFRCLFRAWGSKHSLSGYPEQTDLDRVAFALSQLQATPF